MYNCTITIKGIENARSFVALTARYPKTKITLHCQEYSVDAHSIIGILSLDLSRPIQLNAGGENLESFIRDLEPYTV